MMKKLLSLLLILQSLLVYGQWTSVSIPTTASFRALKVKGNHIWAGERRVQWAIQAIRGKHGNSCKSPVPQILILGT